VDSETVVIYVLSILINTADWLCVGFWTRCELAQRLGRLFQLNCVQLIYLLGPGSSISATSHGDAHVDTHPSNHVAVPLHIIQVAADTQSHEHVEVEPEAGEKNEAGSDQGYGDSLLETEVESAATKITVGTPFRPTRDAG
jgi:hypothetical protein